MAPFEEKALFCFVCTLHRGAMNFINSVDYLISDSHGEFNLNLTLIKY